jgi:guanosine-3',5'-bis(diphosphate) 3'-pyrophosphohydrolase
MVTEENDLKILLQALAFAADKHRNQRRKDIEASPYINHPISLASILCDEGHVSDIEVICAALLHDTIEDTDTTEQELIDSFGMNICHIVMEVTDDKTLDKAKRKQLQIYHATYLSDKAKLVQLADKISNLRDIEQSPPSDWSLQRRGEYYDWAKAVIDQLRGTNGKLEILFDQCYEMRPEVLTS